MSRAENIEALERLDLEKRIARAERKAESFAGAAEMERDEAIGAEAIGLKSRARQCRSQYKRCLETCNVWAATADALKARRDKGEA